MSSPPVPADAGDPPSQPMFPDEILGEIFLRLDSAADLARASAACTAFLRVVRFLRRNRSLYSQPVVGFLECEGPTALHPRPFYHAQPPHLSTSAACDLAEAADFTCSFLPDPGSWQVLDATGGLLLLSSANAATLFKDLVVCDPLQRRYVRIPPIPHDLTADRFKSGVFQHFPCYLAPTGEEKGSSFRVISLIYYYEKRKMAALVFPSATGLWGRVTFDGWEYIKLENVFGVPTSCRYHQHRSPYRASGLFSVVLMLDAHKMVFSLVRTPVIRHCQQHAIVEAGEGRLGFLTIVDGMLDLYCKAWQDNSVSAEEWLHQKTIPIPLTDSGRYSINFCGAGDGYLLLQAIPRDSAELEQIPGIHYFTVQLKTLLVERLCMLNKQFSRAHVYANFLPPLSLPSVRNAECDQDAGTATYILFGFSIPRTMQDITATGNGPQLSIRCSQTFCFCRCAPSTLCCILDSNGWT